MPEVRSARRSSRARRSQLSPPVRHLIGYGKVPSPIQAVHGVFVPLQPFQLVPTMTSYTLWVREY